MYFRIGIPGQSWTRWYDGECELMEIKAAAVEYEVLYGTCEVEVCRDPWENMPGDVSGSVPA